jgi:uncharacterized coiled-coil protein SlyX
MTSSPEDDSDILARLAQAESRLARLESIQARQPLVPGGYVNEIGEQFKTQIDNLLDRRIDRFGDRLEARIDRFGESLEGSSDKLSAKIDELDASFDRLDAKLDLLIELSAKIDWTKYRKLQLEQDKSDDSTQCI